LSVWGWAPKKKKGKPHMSLEGGGGGGTPIRHIAREAGTKFDPRVVQSGSDYALGGKKRKTLRTVNHETERDAKIKTKVRLRGKADRVKAQVETGWYQSRGSAPTPNSSGKKN